MKERSKFSGMTVNERLYEAGLMDAYDKAKAKQDLTQLQRIASEIDLYIDEEGKFWSLPPDRNSKQD